MIEFANKTTNISEIEDTDLNVGFGKCDGSGMTISSPNLNAVFNWITKTLNENLTNIKTKLAEDLTAVANNAISKVDISSGKYTITSEDGKTKIEIPINPVGWIFETNANYASPDEVSEAMGYGTWQRFGEGRVSVGLSSKPSDPSWTKAIGSIFGDYEHTLTTEEIPSHKHSQNDIFNRYVAKCDDVDGTPYVDSNMFSPQTNTTDPADEIAVGNFSVDGFNAQVEQVIGGDKSHNNVQPSIVVAKWVRTA